MEIAKLQNVALEKTHGTVFFFPFNRRRFYSFHGFWKSTTKDSLMDNFSNCFFLNYRPITFYLSQLNRYFVTKYEALFFAQIVVLKNFSNKRFDENTKLGHQLNLKLSSLSGQLFLVKLKNFSKDLIPFVYFFQRA